jgi:hypothetical protein
MDFDCRNPIGQQLNFRRKTYLNGWGYMNSKKEREGTQIFFFLEKEKRKEKMLIKSNFIEPPISRIDHQPNIKIVGCSGRMLNLNYLPIF